MHGALFQSPQIPDLSHYVPLQLPGTEVMPYGGRGLTITSTVAGSPFAFGVENGGWSRNSGLMVQEVPLTRSVEQSRELEQQAREVPSAAAQIGRTPGVAAPWSGIPRAGYDLDVNQVE